MAVNKEFIRKSIREQLSWDDRIASSEIDIEIINDNTVKLTGTAPTYDAKLAAETDAMVVPGVMEVENDLDVKYPSGGVEPADHELSQIILNILQWHNNIDETSLTVNVDGGIAIVEGSVKSFWKKALAEDLIYSVKGILKVINNLTVTPTQNMVDETIADNIINAFKRNRHIGSGDVEVKVEEGYVTLSGYAPNSHTREQIYRTALYTKGVVDIRDRMKIKPFSINQK